jgi:hypothetical protein
MVEIEKKGAVKVLLLAGAHTISSWVSSMVGNYKQGLSDAGCTLCMVPTVVVWSG